MFDMGDDGGWDDDWDSDDGDDDADDGPEDSFGSFVSLGDDDDDGWAEDAGGPTSDGRGGVFGTGLSATELGFLVAVFSGPMFPDDLPADRPAGRVGGEGLPGTPGASGRYVVGLLAAVDAPDVQQATAEVVGKLAAEGLRSQTFVVRDTWTGESVYTDGWGHPQTS